MWPRSGPARRSTAAEAPAPDERTVRPAGPGVELCEHVDVGERIVLEDVTTRPASPPRGHRSPPSNARTARTTTLDQQPRLEHRTRLQLNPLQQLTPHEADVSLSGAEDQHVHRDPRRGTQPQRIAAQHIRCAERAAQLSKRPTQSPLRIRRIREQQRRQTLAADDPEDAQPTARSHHKYPWSATGAGPDRSQRSLRHRSGSWGLLPAVSLGSRRRGDSGRAIRAGSRPGWRSRRK